MNKFKLNSTTRDKIAKIKNKPFVTVNLGRYDSNLDLVDVMSLKLEIVGHKVSDIKKVMCEMFVDSFGPLNYMTEHIKKYYANDILVDVNYVVKNGDVLDLVVQ